MSRAKRAAALAFTSIVLRACLGAENDPWEAFELGSTKAAGATLHYEKTLSTQIGAFRGAYRRFLAAEGEQARRAEALLEKSDQILADVNRIVGASLAEPQKAEQGKFLKLFLLAGPDWRRAPGGVTLYLIRLETIKDYLRQGGSLPDFRYDKAADEAIYRWGFRETRQQERDAIRLVISVATNETVEKDADALFHTFLELARVKRGMALHEVVEWSILARLRPYDPHFRWFTDGFANAIAIRLVRKYGSEEDAKEFALGYDTRKRSGIEKKINLSFWMGKDFEIDTPLESENRLTLARYAYATFEAQRLIGQHGIECVARILDKACLEPRNHSRNLATAILQVTGEDIPKRFQRYQSFETRDDGLRKYTTAFNEAMSRKDYSTALVSMLRIQELRRECDLRFYSNGAYLLFRMGHEAAGDRAIKKQMARLKAAGQDKVLLALKALSVTYALKCRNLEKAYQAAEEVLREKPDHISSLTARTERLANSGKLAEAKEVARRILTLEKNTKSPPYRFAQKVLELKRKTRRDR